jgi:hypothetical protein
MLSASSLVHAAPAIVGRQTPSALAHDSAAPAALYHPPSALSRAPHRTGALAHGLADIWLTKPDRGHGAGARRRRKPGCRRMRELRRCWERVALGRGEYDALISAWLLRKLLLDEQPPVHRANRSRRLKLRFRVYDDQPPEGIEGWAPGYFLCPDPENQSGRLIVELTLDQFLSRPTLVAFGQIITMRDLIKFMANYEGAVHTTVPNDEKTRPCGIRDGEKHVSGRRASTAAAFTN